MLTAVRSCQMSPFMFQLVKIYEFNFQNRSLKMIFLA